MAGGCKDALLIDFDIPIGRKENPDFLIPRLGDQFSERNFSLPRPNKVEFKDFNGYNHIRQLHIEIAGALSE